LRDSPLSSHGPRRCGHHTSVLADRSQFFQDLTTPFYGANRPGATVSQRLRDSFWLQGMQAGFKGVLDCIKAFSETDFTDDLKTFNVPTLILHGDDDQIVPIDASALLSSQIVTGSLLKIYGRKAMLLHRIASGAGRSFQS
jgi:non-heme chloroperoxidase